VVIGTAIHGMAVLVHETSHYSMFRSRPLDRLIGFLMGVPVFVSYTAYRVLHGYHHRYTREEEDPDEFNNVTRNRFLLSLLFYSWLIIGTPVYLIHVAATALHRGTWRDRFDIITEYVLLAVIFLFVYWAARGLGQTSLLIHCWALPMIVAMVFGNVRSWAEHTMTIPGDPFTRTRTVVSNRLVSLLMCNLNYHLEHHLCPGIPWYNLPRMHALLQSEYRQAGSFVYDSYLRFLWDAFRNGVHGISAMRMPEM
jgi:fatty acid desaturase